MGALKVETSEKLQAKTKIDQKLTDNPGLGYALRRLLEKVRNDAEEIAEVVHAGREELVDTAPIASGPLNLGAAGIAADTLAKQYLASVLDDDVLLQQAVVKLLDTVHDDPTTLGAISTAGLKVRNLA